MVFQCRPCHVCQSASVFVSYATTHGSAVTTKIIEEKWKIAHLWHRRISWAKCVPAHNHMLASAQRFSFLSLPCFACNLATPSGVQTVFLCSCLIIEVCLGHYTSIRKRLRWHIHYILLLAIWFNFTCTSARRVLEGSVVCRGHRGYCGHHYAAYPL